MKVLTALLFVRQLCNLLTLSLISATVANMVNTVFLIIKKDVLVYVTGLKEKFVRRAKLEQTQKDIEL